MTEHPRPPSRLSPTQSRLGGQRPVAAMLTWALVLVLILAAAIVSSAVLVALV